MKIIGKVITGVSEGRGLGFPTANLKVEKVLNLENGVFIGKVDLNGKKYNVLVVIGVREEAEVWFENFKDDLYGKILEVEIGDKISEIQKFDNRQELIKKIKADVNIAKSIWQIN